MFYGEFADLKNQQMGARWTIPVRAKPPLTQSGWLTGVTAVYPKTTHFGDLPRAGGN